jgi:hypothetical protein
VAVEAQNAELAFVNPLSEGWEITRREQRLVLAYKAFLEAKGFKHRSLVRLDVGLLEAERFETYPQREAGNRSVALHD